MAAPLQYLLITVKVVSLENLGFIDNSNNKKSDLNSRGLHLQERGSSNLANNILDYFYYR